MPKKLRLLNAFVFAFVFGWCPLGFADVITMANGDRLSGSVVGKNEDKLTFKTNYAGILEIKWAEVRSLRMDDPTEVLLTDKTVVKRDKLAGPGSDPSERGSAKSGDASLDPGSIASIKPKPWETGKTGKFSGRINFAAELEDGNTNSDEIDIDLWLLYRHGIHRYEAKGQLEYDRNGNRNTKRDWLVLGKYDRFFTEQDYFSAWYGAKQEWFAGLELRQFFGPGIGREFYDESHRSLSGELGVFFVDENFIRLPDNRFMGPGFFLKYEREFIKDRLRFYHRNYATLDAGDLGKQLWHSWTGFLYPVYGGLVGSAEFEVDYDSRPALRAKTTDTTFRLKLGYEW